MRPLWLRSISQRPHTAVLLCLLSSVGVLTSMLGPLLVQAVHASTLADALDAAGPQGTSITVATDVEADEPWPEARDIVLGVVAAGTDGESGRPWGEATVLVKSTTTVFWRTEPGAVGTAALVNALDAGCAAYRIATGRCPTGSGQAMMSSVDAELHKVKPGAVISFSLARAPLTAVKIVGIYEPVGSAAADLTRPGTTAGKLVGVDGDPLVLTSSQTAALPLPVDIAAQARLQPGVTIQSVAGLQSSIEQIKASANTQDRVVAVKTGLADLLDRVETQAQSAQVLILVTAIQALFLAIFALAIVLQRVGRARAAEWSVGRLRGIPRLRWWSSIYAEPVVAVLVGLPLGFAAGAGVARLGVDLVLRAGTPVELWRWPVMAFAGGATVLALCALFAVSLRSIRRPLAELVQQEVEGRRLTVVGAVVHTGVFLLAAATLYQLVTGGLLSSNGPQLGLLAPGLFALAVAMLTVRLAVLGVRRITTRPPRSLAALVVGRHAARTPSALNPAMIIAVGVALAVFATQIFAFSVRNQSLRAAATTGASTVLSVTAPADVDLLTAVRAADPGGRQAMAVEDTAVGGLSGIARVVAVDSSRLEAVASWSPTWSGVADLAQALRGNPQPAVTLLGSRLQVELSGIRVVPQSPPDQTGPHGVHAPPPALVLTVETKGRWQQVNLGRINGPGSVPAQRLTAALPCAQGCRVVALGLLAGSNAPYKAVFTVSSVSTDEQPAAESSAWLRTAGRWRVQSINETVPKPTAMATPKATAEGLAIEAFDLAGGNLTSISPADTIDPLPAVLASTTNVEPVPGRPGTGYGSGLDGQQQKLAVLGTASVLPRSLADGVLVDLYNAQGLSDPAKSQTIDQVWLAPDAAPDMERRLSAQGLRVQDRELLSTTRGDLERQATTRGAAVAVVVSSAALLLTLLALVAARWADAGRRGADWRVLREGGVSRRRLRHLVRVEIALPAVLGVGVGALSGAVAARIAAARLPLVDLAEPGPPLDLHLTWAPILLLGLGTALVILVIAHLGALAETRPREGR